LWEFWKKSTIRTGDGRRRRQVEMHRTQQRPENGYAIFREIPVEKFR